MIGKEIAEPEVVPLYKVLEILNKIEKNRELTYEQKVSKEYAELFKVDASRMEKIRPELEKLGISEVSISILLSFAPENPETIRQIHSSENKNFNEEDINKISKLLSGKESK